MADPPVPILEHLKAVVDPLRESIASLDERIKNLNDRLDRGVENLNDRLDRGVENLNKRLDRVLSQLLIGAILLLIGAVVANNLTRPNNDQIAQDVIAALRPTAQQPTVGAPVGDDGRFTSNAGRGLDFEYFRDRVQPVLLNTRRVGDGGQSCAFCHAAGDAAPSDASPFLAELAPGAETWTEAQTRTNFEAVSDLVVPGDPLDSRLLTYPLGVDLDSQPHPDMQPRITLSSPEYRTLAAWIRGETLDQESAP